MAVMHSTAAMEAKQWQLHLHFITVGVINMNDVNYSVTVLLVGKNTKNCTHTV